MIGDSDLNVAKLYNMLPADAGDTAEGRTAANNATVRTVYIIGPDKMIKRDAALPDVERPQLRRGAAPARLHPADREAFGRDAGQLEAGRGRASSSPSVSDEEAKEKYPGGWKTVKPYLRTVPQPVEEPQPVD